MAPTTGSKGPKAKKVARPKQMTNAGVHKPSKPRHRQGHVHVPPLITTSMSESSTISEASLPHLPCELKIQIFGFMNTFSAVNTLSRTSRTFNSIWKLNANHICDAILQRTIESPVEAKALIDAQQLTRHTRDIQNLKGNQKDQNDYHKAVERVQQYLTNVEMASLTLEHFEDSLLHGPTFSRLLSSIERAHFMQAYYRSRVLALLSTNGIPRSLITSWDLLEFKRVYEILEYLFFRTCWQSPRQIPGLFISDEESEPVMGHHNPVSRCEIALHRMELLQDDINAELPWDFLSKPDNRLFLSFSTYESDADNMEKLKNEPLAEILPRLPEGSLCRAVDFDSVLGRLRSL